MANQIIRIQIPSEVVAVASTVNAEVRGGEMVVVSLEPGNDGVITIENQDDGVVITFKKKPFGGEDVIITPPNT